MDQWPHDSIWLGNPFLTWAIAAGGALAGYLVVHGAATLLASHVRKLAGITELRFESVYCVLDPSCTTAIAIFSSA